MFIEGIIIIGILLVFSAIFSIIETSFLSVSLIKANSLVKEKKFGADTFLKLKQNPRRLIICMLLGNTIVNFTAVSIATYMTVILLPNQGFWLATVRRPVLVLFFSQITPKIIAQQNAEFLARLFSKPASILIKLFFPLIYIFEKFSSKISDKFKNPEILSDIEFKTFILAGKKEGILSVDSANIILNMTQFQEMIVKDLMIPKPHIVLLDADKKINEGIKLALSSDYSRFPVYEKNDDNIIGFVSLYGLLKSKENRKGVKKIRSIVVEGYYVPETKKIQDLLKEFQENNIHIAIIINEFGSFLGIVTLDDLLKKFTGKITNQDEEIKSKKKKVIIDGKTSIEEMNRIFHTKIIDSTVRSIAGLIEKELQHIPEKGEKVVINSLMVEVEKITKKRIDLVKVSHIE